jgi:hypothetical protein
MGSWQVLSYTAPLLPIHVALLHTGKVLLVAGSGNDPTTIAKPTGNGVINYIQGYNDSAVWDVNSGGFSYPTTPRDSSGSIIDLFCVGQSFRADGTLLVAGGTLQYDPFEGLPAALLFDPGTQQWVNLTSMNTGRWYPTTTTLANGAVLAVSGITTNGYLNNQPELSAADPTSGAGWSIYPATSNIPMYPHLFLMSDGRVFFSGGCMSINLGIGPRILSVPAAPTQAMTETPVAGLASPGATDQAASVLLPPAQNQRVMIMGGGDSTGTAVNRVAITSNLTAANPTYAVGPSLNYARMHLSAVLLPDRTVFVCNGSEMSEKTSMGMSMLPAEIYNPATNTWTVAETQLVPRVYHSNAFLLPDGRVAAVGGNPQRGTDELRIEIYSPTYMTGKRPVIQSAPSSISYNTTFSIQTPQAGSVKWISLIRPSATTHSCDNEQRVVDLPIAGKQGGSALTVSVTNNPNIAPPGWYMLFLTSNSGIPSTASWVHLS